MLAVSRFDPPAADLDVFIGDVTALLGLLAERPGFVRGRVAQATDEPCLVLLSTEWDSAGSYRRALGDYGVRMAAMPLMAHGRDEASAFEVLASTDQARPALPGPSSRAR